MWKDITMPLHENMFVWPGDAPFRYQSDATLEQDGANVGSIKMSLHAGTHVDAPFHYDDFGKSIDALPIDLFVGPVLIIDVTEQFTLEHIMQCDLARVERVFFKTKSAVDLFHFDEQYVGIPQDVLLYLVSQGVKVVGTDAPSVDAFDAHSLPVHHLCRQLNVYIIENLYLKDVAQGQYDFIGVPLAIQGGDASPIRAIIKKMEEQINGLF